MKKRHYLMLFGLAGAAAAEIALRSIWGFCQSPLYVESKEFEYIHAPNQDVRRFGNRVMTNEYSMRSKPLSGADSIRVLLIGDSVINGGNPTDQDSLASTLLENTLTERFGKPVRVLNISAGSWGPDNAAAYLEKFGNFQARLIVSVVSSHDAHDNMTFEKTVDANQSFPSRQEASAVVELWKRYLRPRMENGWSRLSMRQVPAPSDGTIQKNGAVFNKGFGYLITYSRKHDIPLAFYLHPERTEFERKSYSPEGMEIINYLKQNEAPCLPGIETAYTAGHYRDVIHLTHAGQKHLASVLLPMITRQLAKKQPG